MLQENLTLSLLLIGCFLTRVSFHLRVSVRSDKIDTELRAELRASVTVSLLLIGSFLTRVAFYLRASSQSYARRFESTRVVTRGFDPDSASDSSITLVYR